MTLPPCCVLSLTRLKGLPGLQLSYEKACNHSGCQARGLHEGKHQVAQLEINHPTREEVLDCLTSTGKALNTISGLPIDYKAIKAYFLCNCSAQKTMQIPCKNNNIYLALQCTNTAKTNLCSN